MSYIYSVLKDHPIAFLKLSNDVLDYSSCGNNGEINTSQSLSNLPLTPIGNNSTKITGTSYVSIPLDKDYYTENNTAIANINNSKNEFTLELWILPKISSQNETPIFADISNDTGIFYENGNLIFKVEGQSTEYSLSNTNKAVHVAAIYSSGYISLFIDSKIESKLELNNFSFTSENINFQIGPVVDSNDYFYINSAAVYRYALSSEQIFDHYNQILNTPPIQISYPDNGYLFEFKDRAINKKYTFSYPIDKGWQEIASSPVEYNAGYGYIELGKVDGNVSESITDILSIPSIEDYNHSIIEWEGDNGISVEISQDNSTFYACQNGMPLPITDTTKGIIYLKITFDSSNGQRFNPRLHSLKVSFYTDLKIYALNSADYVAQTTGGGNDFGFTWNNYPILSQSKYNGLRSIDPFSIYTDKDILSIETFYTPESLDSGSIMDQLSWDGAGTLDKSNILSIYVNGVDKTSETLVSGLFTTGEMHHVILVFNNSVTGEIVFNEGSNEALFQYLAIYESQLDAGTAEAHYDMWVGNISTIADGGSLALTENSINYYNNDWIVIQNI